MIFPRPREGPSGGNATLSAAEPADSTRLSAGPTGTNARPKEAFQSAASSQIVNPKLFDRRRQSPAR